MLTNRREIAHTIDIDFQTPIQQAIYGVPLTSEIHRCIEEIAAQATHSEDGTWHCFHLRLIF